MQFEIGEIFKVTSGGTPSREKPEYFENGDIAWVKTGDLKGKYINKPTEYISKAGLDNSSAKLFPPKTVLLAMYGATIGACSILPFEATTNQACAALLPSERCDETYLYYYLTSVKESLVRLGVGGAQPNISAGLIKKIKIPVPPLVEQQKIAAILDAADSLRQKDQQLVERYTALSQSLFLEMFGDPVTNPMGWEIHQWNDILDIKNGKNQKAVEDLNGAYPIYGSGGNVMAYANQFICNENTVIIGRKGNINKPILIKEKFWNVDTAFGLQAKPERLSYLYLYWFCVFFNFETLNKTVTIPSLTKSDLLRIKTPLPPIELQNQFAERIQLIEAQKQQAQRSLEKSEALFNSLLQRAFTGELTAKMAA